MAGIASTVQRRARAGAARGGYPLAVSQVRPFVGADATEGALLVKLGTRIWEGVRERAAEEQAARDQALQEELTRAQIEKLVSEAHPQRYSATVGGKVFGDLTSYQAAQLAKDGDTQMFPVGPDGKINLAGAKLPAAQAVSLSNAQLTDERNVEAERGRNRRADATRALQQQLATIRQTEAANERLRIDTALNASRVLGAIPERPTEGEVTSKAYSMAADSLTRRKKFMGLVDLGRPDVRTLAGRLQPGARKALEDNLASRRAPYLDILKVAATRGAGTGLSPAAQSALDQLQQILSEPE